MELQESVPKKILLEDQSVKPWNYTWLVGEFGIHIPAKEVSKAIKQEWFGKGVVETIIKLS